MDDQNPDTIDKDLQETMSQIEKEEAEGAAVDDEGAKKDEGTSIDNEPKDAEDKETAGEKPDAADESKSESEDGEDEKPESVDYKEKYSNSSREAAILAAKLKKQNEALEKAGQIPKPTEEEMIVEYPDWEDMSATEKRLATDSVWNNRRFEIVEGYSKVAKDIDAWTAKVDTFIEDPKTLIAHPDLEGKADGFKAFAVKETRRGVDFEDLVSAFLWKLESNKVTHKGKMMPTGTGGSKEKPQPVSDKISAEDAARLMETDYNKWMKLLQEGKLASE
jgi:hypothetical protein